MILSLLVPYWKKLYCTEAELTARKYLTKCDRLSYIHLFCVLIARLLSVERYAVDVR